MYYLPTTVIIVICIILIINDSSMEITYMLFLFMYNSLNKGYDC